MNRNFISILGWFISFEERNIKLDLEKTRQILKSDIILTHLVNNSIRNILRTGKTEDRYVVINKAFFSLCLVLSRHKLKFQKRILLCIA